jgi:hypothetical protein
MVRLFEVSSPADVLAEDVVLWPEWVGMAPNYDEATTIYLLRVWRLLQEDGIDTTGFETAEQLDDAYSQELQALADGLGLSMNQFAAAAGTAMRIHESGFHAWYDQFPEEQMIEWEPTNTFEWTHRRQLRDHIAVSGEEGALELFEDILNDKTEEEIESDEELRVMSELVDELSE